MIKEVIKHVTNDDVELWEIITKDKTYSVTIHPELDNQGRKKCDVWAEEIKGRWIVSSYMTPQAINDVKFKDTMYKVLIRNYETSLEAELNKLID